MQYMTSEERLIALDKMTNTRDLGGYETQEGYYTKAIIISVHLHPLMQLKEI